MNIHEFCQTTKTTTVSETEITSPKRTEAWLDLVIDKRSNRPLLVPTPSEIALCATASYGGSSYHVSCCCMAKLQQRQAGSNKECCRSSQRQLRRSMGNGRITISRNRFRQVTNNSASRCVGADVIFDESIFV
jgi:hypothetical protein